MRLTMLTRVLCCATLLCFACSAPVAPSDAREGGSDAVTDIAVGDAVSDIATGDVAACRADLDCADAVYCNGVERCMPGAAGADARGCVGASPASPCTTGQTCDESGQRCTTSCLDGDGDGHRASSCGGDDCDDTDANRFPGNMEVCDATDHDEDCDAITFGVRDADGDGSPDARCCNVAAGGVRNCGTDCDDARADTNPDNPELCNGRDDNCNGMIDESARHTFYADADGDGWGVTGMTVTACDPPTGYAPFGRDCDDTRAAINPAASEVCDAADNDCDGMIDQGMTCACLIGATRPCGTMVGSCVIGLQSCAAGVWGPCVGEVPPSPEVCNGADDDCDGTVDDRVLLTFYRDADGDGFGTTATSSQACVAPAGYVATGGDCNDALGPINPAATESCDGVDNNCDGRADEGLGCMCLNGQTRSCGTDTGACVHGTQTCVGGVYGVCVGEVQPNPETCNLLDDDCNGVVDNGVQTTFYRDADNDMYGVASMTVQACVRPAGYAQLSGDCDDSRATVNPLRSEMCDLLDNNCNGAVDDGITCACTGTTTQNCGPDTGACNHGTQSCMSGVWGACGGAGYIAAAPEVCNNIDDNCDGTIDNNPAATVASCTATPQTTVLCMAGVCNYTCVAPFIDCDGNRATNGCEVDPRSDRNHCGGCAACATLPASAHSSSSNCVASVCHPVCAAGYADCNGVYADGCEVALNTITNCGMCGTACTRASAANHTVNVCNGGVCGTSCAGGYGDCAPTGDSICETDLNTSVAHCASCAASPCTTTVSNATPSCAAGLCTFVCNTGFVRVGTSCGALQPPRPLAPISGAVVTSNRPTLRFALGPNTNVARVRICRDAACATVVQTLNGATGATTVQPAALAPGRYFWRAFGLNGTNQSLAESLAWEFTTFAVMTPAVSVGIGGVLFDGNTDGFDDVAIGQWENHSQYMYAGSAAGLPATQTGFFSISTSLPGAHQSIASTGDLNGDGRPDLVIGACMAPPTGGTAPGSTECSNQAYVNTGGLTRSTGTATPVGVPAASLQGYGYAVSGAGDVDGDGYGDVVVGAYWSGHAFIVFGEGSPFGVNASTFVDLAAPVADNAFGVSVAGACDVNGDGFSDVIVGDYSQNKVHVYFGRAARGTIAATRVERSGVAGSNFGLSVACAGDTNGDGYADVVAGGNGVPGGVASVFRGASGATGLGASAAWTWTGTGGISVMGVQDTNGDGFADILVGLLSPGQATLYRGGTGAASPAATWTIASSAVSFGRFVGAVGLVNGDAYADFIVGACNQPSSCANQASVYLGGTGATAPVAHRTYSMTGLSFGRGVLR